MIILTSNPSFSADQPRHTARVATVMATAYCLTGKTTSGLRTYEIDRCIALSRNLAQNLNVKFGDKVVVDGIGEFTYADRMPPQEKFGRPKADVDIWMRTRKQCLKFGRQKIRISKKHHEQEKPKKPRITYIGLAERMGRVHEKEDFTN